MADKIQASINKMWEPLREVQAEKRAEEKAKKAAETYNKAMNIENDYLEWRDRTKDKRENNDPLYTARGNSLQINISGATPRGPEISSPRGYESGQSVSQSVS